MNFLSVFRSMAFTVIIIAFIISGCEKSSVTNDGKPEGALVKYTDCKNTFTGLAVSDTTPNNLDCIEYNFNNDDGILRLKHINAGFNCCPGKITADISISSDAIIINEKEQSALCDCDCLFDIDYEIKNLDSWAFKIVVVEPYRPTEEAVLEFNVGLKAQPSGKFCVERHNYPWNMN
ncbi:MAG: hypothetical protein A2X61_03505 [Ignavibacteria bacterium GWB2_35_12]|nr:MAG: hypothetical protein A2X63_10180 [Ignavibacteria bacterium GWA2_35_8]OGU42105.1 MAG: hypothetical protein A2X61_03505 [Ignavibacteria bacterium GWB2_35_12]OGU95586.1 MAG: hypothetical protein A2220_06455 [Ignavibacteria bacterium RIFOXYA2_FULL_35_10]